MCLRFQARAEHAYSFLRVIRPNAVQCTRVGPRNWSRRASSRPSPVMSACVSASHCSGTARISKERGKKFEYSLQLYRLRDARMPVPITGTNCTMSYRQRAMTPTYRCHSPMLPTATRTVLSRVVSAPRARHRALLRREAGQAGIFPPPRARERKAAWKLRASTLCM
eukprot:COSAG01_NODE_5015_length_4541_cov_38.651058_1_plen_167_part_00